MRVWLKGEVFDAYSFFQNSLEVKLKKLSSNTLLKGKLSTLKE
jgi:hypothetical protein